jgi:hypothetical protein
MGGVNPDFSNKRAVSETKQFQINVPITVNEGAPRQAKSGSFG